MKKERVFKDKSQYEEAVKELEELEDGDLAAATGGRAGVSCPCDFTPASNCISGSGRSYGSAALKSAL